MNKIIMGETVNSISAKEIPEGQAFIGSVHAYKDKLFLRIFGGFILMENPTKTWTWEGHDTYRPTISNYLPVDLEIKVIRP